MHSGRGQSELMPEISTDFLKETCFVFVAVIHPF